MFRDRREAGRRLAERLTDYAALEPVVLGLARGGVPVAAEVASRLGAPLDVLVVRKVGVPWQPELALGAVAEGDVRILNRALVRELGLGPRDVASAVTHERAELERRVRAYRGDRQAVPVAGRVAIVVDDGLATGATARAAIESMRSRGARSVILAAPVGPPASVLELKAVADAVVVLDQPTDLWAVGQFYRDFRQTSDQEVVELLEAAAQRSLTQGPGGSTEPTPR